MKLNTTNQNPAETQGIGGLIYQIKQEIFRSMRVCLPAIVESYDRAKNRAVITPAITMQTTNDEQIQLPSITDVPVVVNGGGGYCASFPLAKGDTGWIIFNDKDISLFKQNETISSANTLRKHNLADCVFIADVMGKASITDSGAVWQTYDGSTKAVLSESGIDIKGNLNVDGNITATGNIRATGDVMAGTISLLNHTHTCPSGGGTSSKPQ